MNWWEPQQQRRKTYVYVKHDDVEEDVSGKVGVT